MTLSPQSPDTVVDRALAYGRPAGPELDEVWARVQQTRARAHRRTWFVRLAQALMPAVAVAAALVVWLQPADMENANVVARGSDAGGPLLEASCGGVDTPCAMGTPIFLRLHGGDTEGTAVVVMDEHVLFGPIEMKPGAVMNLPITISPEESDLDSGVTVAVRFLPEGAPDGAAVLDSGSTRYFTFSIARGSP